MIPSGSMSIKIDRERLARVVGTLDATPTNIDWIGPTTVTVTRIKLVQGRSNAARPSTPIQEYKSATSTATQIPTAINQHPTATLNRPTVQKVAWTPSDVSPTDRRRWQRVFESSVQRFAPEIAEQYEIEVRSSLTAELASAVILEAHITPPNSDGVAFAHLLTRFNSETSSHEIELQLTAHPSIIVASSAISRGTKLSKGMFELRPTPQNEIPSGAITDFDLIVGMQANAALRASQPVTFAMIGEPVVVRRGDMVELRVVGGGVSVTTNARTLSEGVVNELIEVETISPRKRVIARVVHSSLVEIATRSPVVR